MCLGIPAQVINKNIRDGLLYGEVTLGGICKEICLEYTKEVEVGQYVLVHVGFSLSIIDKEEVDNMHELLNELDDGF